MSSRAGAVFLFDLDGYVSAFRSVEEAAAWMEPNDVLDGEYPAVFTLDGHVVTPTTTDANRVTLTVTEERDEASLMHWLKESGSRYGLTSPADDVLAVANAAPAAGVAEPLAHTPPVAVAAAVRRRTDAAVARRGARRGTVVHHSRRLT